MEIHNYVIDLMMLLMFMKVTRSKRRGVFYGSLAYIFGKRGTSFITLKDYQNSHIGPNDNNVFIALNNQIDQNWRSVSTYRGRGEYH